MAADPEPTLPQQAALVAALRQHLAAQTGAPVLLLETHISWVLVAGERAYKLKKALRTPFLDAHTLALRHAQGLEELRLNRRLAPALYLDLLPVTGPAAAPRLGGPGSVLEWAVAMRAFAQQGLWQHLAEHGTLRPEMVDALALQLAQFHAAAAVAPPDGPWGSGARVRDALQDNLNELAPLLEASQCAKVLAPLQAWAQAQGPRLAPLFARRLAQGFVREGHGDLHLGNVVQIDGQPTAFDGIDFNPALRWIDTADDIAFLAMDLQAHGLPALAHRFVNAWVEASGDVQGLRLLPWYQVNRALVRAKVALLRAVQPGERGGPGEARDRESAQRYLDLAVALATQPARLQGRPALLLMHGLAGSGKSTLALALVQAMGALRLRSDVQRKRLAGLAPGQASGSALNAGLYDAANTQHTYRHLLRLAAAVLHGGRPVVLDASFLRRAPRDAARRLARRLGVPLLILDLVVDEATLRQRLLQRRQAGQDPSEADAAVLQAQLASAEALQPDEMPQVLRLPPPLDLQAVHDALARQGASTLCRMAGT
ncbi:hypothetical protein BurJ1DRAFT_4979 [Burkholderiales bacterium JOSHI_001]|nr:hypothetical protein BurJ1DRAFT_4979 [Burkholderiales bacterium JOSHI_001]